MSLFVGYESSRELGRKCLSLGTNRLRTKDPWVRNDWIPEETFCFGSDAISDQDTTSSDINNCYSNRDRRWKGVGGFLNRHILVKEE